MSIPKTPPSNLQLVSDKEVAISLERLINSVVMEATAPRSALQPQQVRSNDHALGINSLPDEMIEEVFGYLTQNQLGEIARVCRRWNLLTKSPVLWKNVHVEFSNSHQFQTIIAESLINGLPSCVSSIALDFTAYEGWIGTLCFVEFCMKLQQKCPHLEQLRLIHSTLYENLASVIDVCSHFLEDVKNLIFHNCIFSNYPVREEFGCTSKIEVLDLTCSVFDQNYVPQFSKMPCLKMLCIHGTSVNDSWFVDDSSFLNQLQMLNVGYTDVTAITFPAIQNHGHNLKQLYLCRVNLGDHDLTNSVFPHLNTICLSLTYVTCEGVVSFIQSCPSLQNVYVDDEDVAESFAAHPFVVANRCKSSIVKTIISWHFGHN